MMPLARNGYPRHHVRGLKMSKYLEKCQSSTNMEVCRVSLLERLRVEIHDLRLLVDELRRVATSKCVVDEVKDLIWKINSFSPSSKDLERLQIVPVFPVRKAGSEGLVAAVCLRVWNGKFSIIDRQPLAELFQGKIDFLDFTLAEVRRLQPFLSSFDLQHRYLSRAVCETTFLQDEIGVLSREQTRRIRSRAHALAR
jgi:hypothetical protein